MLQRALAVTMLVFGLVATSGSAALADDTDGSHRTPMGGSVTSTSVCQRDRNNYNTANERYEQAVDSHAPQSTIDSLYNAAVAAFRQGQRDHCW